MSLPMSPVRIRSASQQVAEYLREEIRSRKWIGIMPGENWLVAKLQIGRDTVRAAMAQLEDEGVLASDGKGRSRRIVMNHEEFVARKIRLRIFLYEKQDRGNIDCSSLLAELLAAGIDADFTAKSLKELGMQVPRVARYVKKNPADAWVLMAASRDIITWFSMQPTPANAMYGSAAGLPIAAAYPAMIPGQTIALRRLIELGHRRIVMLTREERRKPGLSRPEQAFINQLEEAGIKTGEYNLPDWEETREGLGRLLDELFRVSPPTAMIFQESQLYLASRFHLAERGIVAPRNISLIVADRDASFDWCNPIPSHINWDYRPVVRNVVRWAKNVARGRQDFRTCSTDSEFVEGGTLGPVP